MSSSYYMCRVAFVQRTEIRTFHLRKLIYFIKNSLTWAIQVSIRIKRKQRLQTFA